MKIRFCDHNKGAGKVIKKLKEDYPEMNIKRKNCLSCCGICKKTPFALVQGETIKADDGDELYKKIVKSIKAG